MSSTLPTVGDCCGTCDCNVVSVSLPCPPGTGGAFLTVINTSALRLVLVNQRVDYMTVNVLTDVGTPLDGTGYLATWMPDDLTPDAPPLSVRPADVPSDADPGRFRQIL